MKNLFLLIAALSFGFAFANTSDSATSLADRLKPAGNVCVMGQPCETAAVAASAAVAAGPKSGDEVYSAACAACHASGVLNSPMFGNAEQWAPRVAKGAETLYANAINGINAMPAKGGNSSLSDEEVMAAVDHMMAAAQ